MTSDPPPRAGARATRTWWRRSGCRIDCL